MWPRRSAIVVATATRQGGNTNMSQSGLSRRMLALAALAAAALGIYVGLARGSAGEDSPKSTDSATYTIGLFGDMPYNAMGKADYPFLLQDINAEKVSFSVFDG